MRLKDFGIDLMHFVFEMVVIQNCLGIRDWQSRGEILLELLW